MGSTFIQPKIVAQYAKILPDGTVKHYTAQQLKNSNKENPLFETDSKGIDPVIVYGKRKQSNTGAKLLFWFSVALVVFLFLLLITKKYK